MVKMTSENNNTSLSIIKSKNWHQNQPPPLPRASCDEFIRDFLLLETMLIETCSFYVGFQWINS